MFENSLVSVIIPTFNRSKTIGRVIKSCFSQSHQEIEIIIVDDCSSDNTAEIVEGFKDSRIRYLLHNNNSGPAAAKNTGLHNMRGEFVAFLDSDDEWLPNKISQQLEVFSDLHNRGETAGLIFVNGYSGYNNVLCFSKDKPSGFVFNPEKDNFFPLRVFIAAPSSWMLKSEVVSAVGYFDERMYCWEDGDYLARIAYKYPIYFFNRELVIWHASTEHLNKVSEKMILGKELFLENNLKFMEKDKEYLFKFYRALGKDAIHINKLKAREYFIKAFLMKPYELSLLGKLFKTF